MESGIKMGVSIPVHIFLSIKYLNQKYFINPSSGKFVWEIWNFFGNNDASLIFREIKWGEHGFNLFLSSEICSIDVFLIAMSKAQFFNFGQ